MALCANVSSPPVRKERRCLNPAIRSPQSAIPENRWVLRTRAGAEHRLGERRSRGTRKARRVVWHGGHIGRSIRRANYTFLYEPGAEPLHRIAVAPPPAAAVAWSSSPTRIRAGGTITLDGGVEPRSLAVGRPSLDYTRVWFKDALGPWLYDSATDEWEDCRPVPPEWVRNASGPSATSR